MVISANIKKALRLIFVDALALLVGILNGFFLPAVFSVENYSLFRTFTLYATYAAIFSLGFSESIYLSYGGKSNKSIDKSELKTHLISHIKIQLIVFITLFLLSNFIIKNDIFTLFTLFVLPLQIIHFFRLYFRATGEFDKYSILQGILVALEFINTFLIILVFKFDNPVLYIYIKILNHFVVAILLLVLFFIRFRKTKKNKFKSNNLLTILKPGIHILIVDLISILFFSLDRWFIMIYFNNYEFAYYSFAVSILALFIVFITSISNIFYPYLSKFISDKELIKIAKNYIFIIASFIPVSYFLLYYIISTYLSSYIDSIDILKVLIVMVPFIANINIINNNVYKATKNVDIYMKRSIYTFMVALILNIISIVVFRNITSIAFATVISFTLWLSYSSSEYDYLKLKPRDLMHMFIWISTYYFTTTYIDSLIVSSVCYFIIVITSASLLYTADIKNILLRSGVFAKYNN